MPTTVLDRRRTQAGAKIPVTVSNQGNIPLDVTGDVNIAASYINVPVEYGDSGSLDAFGRLRASQPISRFDAQLTYDLQPLLFEQVTSGATATITHEAVNRAAFILLNNSPSGSYAYLQSYKHAYYHPGNGQLVFLTFNFGLHIPNVTKFVGYGDFSNNGIHLISNGTTFAWRILSNTDNGDQTVLQANWNLDKLNGSGPSGLTLDVGRTQIAIIDLQALYVGRVRVGFNISGTIVYCHEFLHANVVSFPYIQTATLPIIAGMTCSVDDADADMLFVCCTVRSEGSTLEEEGFDFSAEGTVAAGNGTRTHILSVRPNATFNGIVNRINFIAETLEILVTGNSPVLWELCIGQDLTNPNWTDANAVYSGFEYDTTGTLNGNPAIVVARGYCAATAAAKTSISADISNRYPITLDAAGNTRLLGTLSLLVTGLGGTSATRASLNWREIR